MSCCDAIVKLESFFLYLAMSSKRTLIEISDSHSNNAINQPTEDNDTEDLKGLDAEDDNDNDNGNNAQIKQKLATSGEPIILNVGGAKYATSLVTLTSDTNSILHKMFNGSFFLKPSKDGSYFIDRNGKYFEYVLDYFDFCLEENKKNAGKHLTSYCQLFDTPIKDKFQSRDITSVDAVTDLLL